MDCLSLETLLNSRENEFQEIASVLEIDSNKQNWKNSILDFCLEFHDCLQNWTNNTVSSSYEIQKCNNKMRQISRKSGISEMLQILYVINKIAEDYKTTQKK